MAYPFQPMTTEILNRIYNQQIHSNDPEKLVLIQTLCIPTVIIIPETIVHLPETNSNYPQTESK